LAPLSSVVDRLLQLQTMRRVTPFPDSPCRNYNALGCGFDLKTGRYCEHQLWSNVPEKSVPKETAEVLQQWEKFISSNSQEFKQVECLGVRVLTEFLKAVKDRRRGWLVIISGRAVIFSAQIRRRCSHF